MQLFAQKLLVYPKHTNNHETKEQSIQFNHDTVERIMSHTKKHCYMLSDCETAAIVSVFC